MDEIRQIGREIERACGCISNDDLQHTVDAIEGRGRVFVYGTGRSGLMLRAFAMRLMQMGIRSYVVGETICPSIAKGDLLVVGSASGRTESVLLIASSAIRQGAHLLVISGTKESPLAEIKTPDFVIDAPNKFGEGGNSIQPMGSLFEQTLLATLDAIILRMLNDHETTRDSMATEHANLE